MDDNEIKEEEKARQALAKRKSRIKKGIIISIAALTGLSISAVVAAKEGYDYMFRRYERPDYNLKAGVYCIERANIEREEMYFSSNGIRLKGYYYPCESAKGMVVLLHGIHAGGDDYLPMAQYFVKNGFAAFSFDYCGTYDSEGDGTVGMCQSLVDADGALKYIKSEPKFKNLPLFLVGHSWGGYAAGAVLALHDGISGCATIAAPNSGFTIMLEKGEQYAGKLGTKGLPEIFLNIYQKILFGDYVGYSGAVGINASKVPVLVAHGDEDKVIDINRQSIYAHRDNVRQDGVIYYISSGEQGGHESIWHSKESVAYSKAVNDKLAKMKKDGATYEEMAAFVASVDHDKYSEVNKDLFDKIINTFESAL